MRRATALALLCTPLLLAGCTRQLDRIETGVTDVRQQQLDQSAELQELQARFTELQDLVQRVERGERERRAAIEAQIGALDRAVQRMNARAEEQEELLRRLRAGLDMLLRQQGANSASPPATDGGGGEAPVPSGSPGTDVYDSAFADFTRGNYALARQGFEELLQRYPASDLADDAAYWLAETWYAEGDYRQALQLFGENLRKYASSDTVPPTLLKMGYCQVELQQPGPARDSFARLVREHPSSDEARIAEHKLGSMPPSP